MKRIRLMPGLSICLALLAGCTVGHWNICGPQTPRAYCYKEAYDALVNPVTPRDKWTMPDLDTSQLSRDWQVCGGMQNGNIAPDRSGATGLETAELSREKLYAAQRCMMSKGYQYIGTCEGDITSRFPACQARSR